MSPMSTDGMNLCIDGIIDVDFLKGIFFGFGPRFMDSNPIPRTHDYYQAYLPIPWSSNSLRISFFV